MYNIKRSLDICVQKLSLTCTFNFKRQLSKSFTKISTTLFVHPPSFVRTLFSQSLAISPFSAFKVPHWLPLFNSLIFSRSRFLPCPRNAQRPSLLRLVISSASLASLMKPQPNPPLPLPLSHTLALACTTPAFDNHIRLCVSLSLSPSLESPAFYSSYLNFPITLQTLVTTAQRSVCEIAGVKWYPFSPNADCFPCGA